MSIRLSANIFILISRQEGTGTCQVYQKIIASIFLGFEELNFDEYTLRKNRFYLIFIASSPRQRNTSSVYLDPFNKFMLST